MNTFLLKTAVHLKTHIPPHISL